MNKYGKLSLLMVVISMMFSFLLRPENAGLFLAGFVVFSLLGIIFACLSKRWYFIMGGIVLNGVALVFLGLLVLGMGVGEE